MHESTSSSPPSNLNDCPSGHWQVGRPLPQGFPGRSPHCLLSMIDLNEEVLARQHSRSQILYFSNQPIYTRNMVLKILAQDDDRLVVVEQ